MGVIAAEGKDKNRQRHRLPAAFTVEAALLMPLLLGILILILMAGFYMHDRACMQGAACEAAAMGSNLQVYEDQNAVVQKLGRNLLSGRLMWSRNVSGSAAVSGAAVSAAFTGSFTVPGIVGQLWNSRSGEVKGSWSRSIYQPAVVIRRIRGAKYLTEVWQHGGDAS